jgi:hypothetical protein
MARTLTIRTNGRWSDDPKEQDEALNFESLKYIGEMLENGFTSGLDMPHGIDWELKEISEEA